MDMSVFKTQCKYCGKREDITKMSLLPGIKGGEDRIGYVCIDCYTDHFSDGSGKTITTLDSIRAKRNKLTITKETLESMGANTTKQEVKILKSLEYLEYIEEHINNINQAFKNISKDSFIKAGYKRGYHFSYSSQDMLYWRLQGMVEQHDISKLSDEEFDEYRRCFHPINDEEKTELRHSWEHHKENNSHHWQTWTEKYTKSGKFNDEIYLDMVHNFIDWYAMSMKFGGKPLDYYRAKSDEIHLPDFAVKAMEEIEQVVIEQYLTNDNK